MDIQEIVGHLEAYELARLANSCTTTIVEVPNDRQLTDQFQTRLSYAMIKVQNGWQTHNISELENMASNQASTVFTVSDAPQLDKRHLPTNLPSDQSKSMQLSERTAAAPKYACFSPRNGAMNPDYTSRDLQHENFEFNSRPTNVGAAYESFWRDHEASGTSRPTETPIEGPLLAPPAHIAARASRRSDMMKNQPPPLAPPLRTNDFDTDFANITPPPKRQPKFRTPSQQAEVEKDAVETLLFMSSPGSSGYYPPRAFTRTPLQNHVVNHADQMDRLAFSRPDETGNRAEQPYSQHLLSPAGKRTLSNAEMDTILDEMSDTSSSDDGELQDQSSPAQILGTEVRY